MARHTLRDDQWKNIKDACLERWVEMRYDKLVVSYMAFVLLAATFKGTAE